ncbi:MAG TPA: IS630 family transposase [Gemmatimonadales bacterium]
MGRPTASRIHVAPPVRSRLERLARSATAPRRLVDRACIVLAAAAGQSNAKIARTLGFTEKTVRKWRGRFAARSTRASLDDHHRSGRPESIPVEVRCELMMMACDRPPEIALRDIWTYASLSERLMRSTGWRLSQSEIGRILRAEDFRPHRMRLWLHSPDPDFREKVRVICQLYTQPPLGAHVVCIDEKTCMQALERKHPGRRPAPGRAGRREFEYVRHGTRALLAAFDVKTGRVFGQCRPRRTAEDLRQFMDALAENYPTGDVYVIWDNLNIHHGEAWRHFNERHGGRFHFVYTPLHASWVNQVEIWFSILQKRVLKHGDFRSPAELAVRVMAFISHWNRREAHPFRWTFRGRFTQHPDRQAA